MSESKTETIERQFADQLDDEEVLLMFRRHPIVMRRGLVFGMLGPLIGILPTAIWPTLGFGWFFGGFFGGIALGLLIFFPSWMNWYYSVFIVTDIRFIQITQKGLFNKTFVDLSLNQIQSLNYEIKGLQANIFSYGTILVQTYMGDLALHELYRPAKLFKQLTVILREQGVETAKKEPRKSQSQEEDEIEFEEEA